MHIFGHALKNLTWLLVMKLVMQKMAAKTLREFLLRQWPCQSAQMFNKMIYSPSQYFKWETAGETDSLLQDLINIMCSGNGLGLKIMSTKLHIYQSAA